jgi:DNA modification methylase
MLFTETHRVLVEIGVEFPRTFERLSASKDWRSLTWLLASTEPCETDRRPRATNGVCIEMGHRRRSAFCSRAVNGFRASHCHNETRPVRSRQGPLLPRNPSCEPGSGAYHEAASREATSSLNHCIDTHQPLIGTTSSAQPKASPELAGADNPCGPWEGTEYSLYQADCFQVFKALPDRSVDALITDPPYGRTSLPWNKAVDWPAFWREADRICTQTAVMVLFSAQPFTTDLINSNRSGFRYELIWHKTLAVGWLSANRRPLRAHENILVFARKFIGSTYNPQKELGHKPYRSQQSGTAAQYARHRAGNSQSLTSERHPRSVLHFPSRREVRLHPTQKPLGLLEWLVHSYTNPGETVLDPLMGSSTTGVACRPAADALLGWSRSRNTLNGRGFVSRRRLRIRVP